MQLREKTRIATGLLLILAVIVLMTGCGGSQAEPATPEEPASTQGVAPTLTQAPAPPTVVAAVATEAATVTASPEAARTAEAPADDSGTQVTYELPMKGSRDAPVTIIEFSDYL